jgi:beta-glucosidase-like glycosyl hydrolase
MKQKLNKIIFGLSGKTLTQEEKEFFLKSQPLGVILFSRNIESSEQLQNLTNSLKDLLPEVKIFIDQEGGRVARIKPPIAKKLYPKAEYFSDLYQKDEKNAQKEVKENYSELMSELGSFKIDSPCAPVCDLLYKDAHSVIGDRSFGENVQQVVDLCRKAIEAINEQKGIAFVKHIPGHGRSKVDSHHGLPVVDTDLETLEQTDFKVFKELANEPVWAMTAHIIYTALDDKKPATLSSKVIKYIRENIGFKGPLVTDDICMKALHTDKNFDWNTSLAKVAKESIEAGCDIVLHCSGKLDEMEAVWDVIG